MSWVTEIRLAERAAIFPDVFLKCYDAGARFAKNLRTNRG